MLRKGSADGNKWVSPTACLRRRGGFVKSVQEVQEPQKLHGSRLWIFSKDAGPTDQIIHYEADLEKDVEIIEGTYESSNPADRGTFRVRRKNAR